MLYSLERFIFRLPSGSNQIRCRILRRWKARIGSEVCISRHAQFFNPSNIDIGNNTVVGNSYFQAWNSISIGRNVIIGEDVKLLTGSHNLHSPDFESKLTPIKIEDYAWIATGAIVLGGVTVAYGGVVGAGAVVRKDVPPLGIVIGNPAELIGFRRCKQFNYYPNQSIPWT